MEEMSSTAMRAELRRFVVRLVGDGALADDILQETLLRALRSEARASSFGGRAKLGTWLAAIAVNVTRDHFRRASTREEVLADDEILDAIDDGDDTEQALLEREMGACIGAHVMALPERQRLVLTLHDMGGADHHEVAEVLATSEGNVRVLLHRARAALRDRLSRNCRLSFGCDAVPCTPVEKPPGFR